MVGQTLLTMIANDAMNELKELGINLHIIATGGGAGLQKKLWETPGSSAYLSGASFPYSQQEQQSLLGFVPDQFCSEGAAIDLASAAYMKAYQWNAKRPVGIGLTASVASETVHRGDHRVHVCVMTDDKVLHSHHTLDKATGLEARLVDDTLCNQVATDLLQRALGLASSIVPFKDVSRIAKERFFHHPFFQANGTRLVDLPKTNGKYQFGCYALMSGAFNPPHQAHFGIADIVMNRYGKQVVFELTAEPPHKEALTVQQLLQRAKLLQGHHRLFSLSLPRYLDKARKYPGIPLVMGVDAAQRMLDPQWGFEIDDMLGEFEQLQTKFYVASRTVNGEMRTKDDLVNELPTQQGTIFHYLSYSISSEWNHLSSTEIRKSVYNGGHV